MKVLYRFFLILLVIGGLNRGLYAWFDLNLVATVFPDLVTTSVDATGVSTTITTMSLIAKIVYSLVAIGAVRSFIANLTCCDKCCNTTK